MDSETQQQQQGQADQLNDFGKVAAHFVKYGANASNNLKYAFSNITTEGWIRMVIIVGGYMLLRPYILKFTTNYAVKRMEQADAKEKAQISPNELRGGVAAEEEEEEESANATSSEWGTKARVRQRAMLKAMLEAEEKRREEEEDDKDIADLLED